MPAKPDSGQLEQAIASGRFVITAEITPPVSCNRDDLLARALPLKGLADAVNVTDGAGARAHLGAMAAAMILLGSGIEPVLQLTCRDRNRLALQSDLIGAAALGIRNLLVLRRYVARLAEHGLTERIALLIGVVPLRSGRSARWIKEQLYGAIIPDDIVERLEYSGDPAAEGRQICADFIEQLATVPGVAGAHI